jgi:hypothetical protein
MEIGTSLPESRQPTVERDYLLLFEGRHRRGF